MPHPSKKDFDVTPDIRGLIRWLGEVAKTDRPTAMKILVDGWPMSVKQAEKLLDKQGERNHVTSI